jgi:peptide-methionine (R)-S-oxide reductase
MNRRTLMLTTAAALVAPRAFAQDCGFEICRTEAEWRARLTGNEYLVMRDEQTERAFTSPLNDETRAGTYHCKGCDLPLYASGTKYDSGTGWPSFFDNLPDAVRTREDRKLLFQVRTEVHCRRCGSHLGHIFDDGPQPTGKRHCLNGLSLTFRPATA